MNRGIRYYFAPALAIVTAVSLVGCSHVDREQQRQARLRVLTYNTHLCHRNEQVRTMQTAGLSEFADSEGDAPVILAGDFNARPASGPMNVLLESDWLDAVAPQSRIDYVLLRKGDPWKIVDVRVIDEPVASDHDPVLVTLQWMGK